MKQTKQKFIMNTPKSRGLWSLVLLFLVTRLWTLHLILIYHSIWFYFLFHAALTSGLTLSLCSFMYIQLILASVPLPG